MPALRVSEHMAPSPTLAAKRLADLPMRPGMTTWCGPNGGCNMCWHWNACCMHALILNPMSQVLGVWSQVETAIGVLHGASTLWKWMPNTNKLFKHKRYINHFLVALFLHLAPYSPKAWQMFGMPSNCALHLGNAMTKQNIFNMSHRQIQPVKYQAPGVHETDMDRSSLFGLVLILDRHLFEVPLRGPRVWGEHHRHDHTVGCWNAMSTCSYLLDNVSQELLCLLHHWLAILIGALTESWLRSGPLWCTWCKTDSIATSFLLEMYFLRWWIDSSWSLNASNHQGT